MQRAQQAERCDELSEAIQQLADLAKEAKAHYGMYRSGTMMKSYWHGEYQGYMASLKVLRQIKKRRNDVSQD